MSARRCKWCGATATYRDKWPMWELGTCRNCADLERITLALYDPPRMRDELREAVKQR